MTPGNASRTAFGHWGRGILPKRSTSREAGGGDHHVVPRSKDRVKPSVGKEPAWTRRDEEACPRILQAGAVAFYTPCRLVSNAQGTHRTQQPNNPPRFSLCLSLDFVVVCETLPMAAVIIPPEASSRHCGIPGIG